MFLILSILISICFSFLPFIKKIWKKQKWKKIDFIFISILFLGALSRILLIEKFPVGLNQDEASIGYEAYSLLNFGIDRNGNSFPIHFIAWGSGQNALYAYLVIPFIKMLGANTFAIRLPMAVVGIITLLMSYVLFKEIEKKDKKVLLALFIMSIFPWHIIKSRWGLESNLFPDLIYWASIFIYFGIKRKQKKYFIFSSIILGIATYSYGTSYLYVPLFCLFTYSYLIYKKEIKSIDAFIFILITTVISVPMILFVVINYFKLETMHLFSITIPKLDYNRFTEITSLKGSFFSNCFSNLFQSFKIILTQKDGLVLNYLPYYGIYYYISFPFLIYGIYSSVKTKEYYIKLNPILLITGIFICAFTEPNINRINIIWFPLIIYTIYGILKFINAKKNRYLFVLGIYFLMYLGLSYSYFKNYQNTISKNMFNGLQEAIAYSQTLNYEKIYITNEINQPYIYFLWYTKKNTNEYLEKRKIREKKVMFQEIESIENVYFEKIKTLKKENVYILPSKNLTEYNLTEFNIVQFINYSVLHRK